MYSSIHAVAYFFNGIVADYFNLFTPRNQPSGSGSRWSNISLQIIGETPAHLFALCPVLCLFLATIRAVTETAAPLEILTAHAADIGNSLVHL